MNIMYTISSLILLLSQILYITCIWHPSNYPVHNKYPYQFNTYYPARKYNEEQPMVEQVKTVKYHGNTYRQVMGLKLPFHQAENYCNQVFTSESHLASIQSDEEWKMLSKCFGDNSLTKIWLGGTADLVNHQYIVLQWFDKTAFKFLRFPDTERGHWQQILKNRQGCIIGNLKNNGQGEWSIQAMSCDEPKEFICKETNSDFQNKPWDTERSRLVYMPQETPFQHFNQPPVGILSLHGDMYQPKIPTGPKKSIIAHVSNVQTVIPTTDSTEQQVHPTPPVQPKINNNTITRINISESKHFIKPTKKPNNMTELQATTISRFANKNVKFVIIKSDEPKTVPKESNNEIKSEQGKETSPENQSGPVTIYLQGVSVPGNEFKEGAQ
ncbi:unnamed protein product [Schistosoma rodhaini]|uniref:C-type lectin domain-containing protein n=1 Tax=Schistosoma rodhaini TaxID=6188 RepID=A0A183QRM4_9TREM|nr:unnamed protein product [Schistosoma rodhaini]CAH8577569.1 unnamed protein product [Schistosoma rodhaini]